MLPLILVAVGAYLIGDSVLGDKKYDKGGMSDGGKKAAKKRLEELRKELRAEKISYSELAELESLKEYIDDDDIELRQATGIPEYEDEDDDDDDDKYAKGGKLEVGDMVMVDDSGYAKYFSGFDVSKPAKITSKNKGKSFGKVKYFYGLETADGKKPFNQAIESMLTKVSKDGGMMAHGGKTQGYDDKEDERLAMEHGKISKKDLDSTHARRDDARFEERGKMAKGGEIEVGDKVKAKNAKYHATVTEIVDDVEVPYAKITYSDGRVKKADLQNLQKVELRVAEEYVNPNYMAKGGSIAENTTVEVGEDKISVIKNRKEKTGFAVYVQAKGYAPMTLDVYATKEAAMKKAKALAKKNGYKLVG